MAKILIIEDEYRQYKIIRDLLKRDYEICNDVLSQKDFNSLHAKLLRLLKGVDASFQEALDNYTNVSAFVVDYELKEGSKDKTGILFCKRTDCISTGETPVLFLTKEPSSTTTNELTNVQKEIPLIVSNLSRKPEMWNADDKNVDEIVSLSVDFYKIDMRGKINTMLAHSHSSEIGCLSASQVKSISPTDK